MNDVMIGCDPEYFVKVKGDNVSAHGLVDGDKANPLKLQHGAVQVDGTALEFNIDPARTREEFLYNIDAVLDQVRALVPKKYEFAFDPVADYDEETYKNIPADALVLGCEPDFNAYSGEINNAPNAEVMFRTAAGHVHFGWTDGADPHEGGHFMDSRSVTAMADYLIGLPLAVMEPGNKRKDLYGKAGAFRPKPYGCEWRTSSNFWLKNEELRGLVYDQSIKVIEFLNEGYTPKNPVYMVQSRLNYAGRSDWDYYEPEYSGRYDLSEYRSEIDYMMREDKKAFGDIYDYVMANAYSGGV